MGREVWGVVSLEGCTDLHVVARRTLTGVDPSVPQTQTPSSTSGTLSVVAPQKVTDTPIENGKKTPCLSPGA